MTIRTPNTQIIKHGIAASLGTQVADDIPAVIGNPADNSILVTGTDKVGMVWISGVGADPASAFPAVNNLGKDALIFGAPVLVKRGVNGFTITSKDPDRDGEFYRGAIGLHDQKPVLPSQIMYGNLLPTSPTPSMRVQSIGALYDIGGVAYRDRDQDTEDFSASPLDTLSVAINVPTSNTRAIGVLVQLDPTTGLLSYKQGTEFDANLSHQQAFDAGYYPQLDADRQRKGYVRLVAGMTFIGYQHIYFTPPFFGGSGGDDIAPLVLTGWP